MPGSYYLVLIWTKHCKTIVSPPKNDNFYFCTRRKQLHFSVLFRKNQNIFYVGVLNDCSKPSLGGQVAAICFPAVWWKFRLWIWCRWAVRKLQTFVALQIWPDTNCALWPESLFGLHGWRSPCCRWGVPPCFSVRQTKQVLKNVNEVQELRVLNQSWKCVIQSWYILSALIWHTCDNWPNPSPLQADYCTMFEICSRIEAHLVVGYSCPQSCASGAHVWCHLDHGRWFTVNVTLFLLRFWGKDTQAAEDSVPPKWKRVFVSSTDRATKEFSEIIATYSMLNRLYYVQLS